MPNLHNLLVSREIFCHLTKIDLKSGANFKTAENLRGCCSKNFMITIKNEHTTLEGQSVTGFVGRVGPQGTRGVRRRVLLPLLCCHELLNGRPACLTFKLNKPERLNILNSKLNLGEPLDVQENIWTIWGTPTSHCALVIYNDRKANAHIWLCSIVEKNLYGRP